MEDLIRLVIHSDRLMEIRNNLLHLTRKESHYINNVMRLKNGENIFIINGKGSLWRGIKKNTDQIELVNIDKPYLSEVKKKILLGLAIAIPKKGFEDILKMCTEIGIDVIQPIFTDHQVKIISERSNKFTRWDSIINESVEQSERLWKPMLLECVDINEWINNCNKNNHLSISVTRHNNSLSLREWLNKQEISQQESTYWNIVGPEGGWSKNELKTFQIKNIQFVSLSKTILRTSTAAVNVASIFNDWRNNKIKLTNCL